jgi:hypothetical protein
MQLRHGLPFSSLYANRRARRHRPTKGHRPRAETWWTLCRDLFLRRGTGSPSISRSSRRMNGVTSSRRVHMPHVLKRVDPPGFAAQDMLTTDAVFFGRWSDRKLRKAPELRDCSVFAKLLASPRVNRWRAMFSDGLFQRNCAQTLAKGGRHSHRECAPSRSLTMT